MSTIYTSFKYKIIIIAGGASGIGEHLVRQLSSFAQTIIILDRDKKGAARIISELAGEVLFEHIDMSDEKSVVQVLTRLNKQHDGIDYFFNTAGIFMAGEMRDTPVKNWNAVMEGNLQPIINGTTVMYEIMQQNGYGHIINFASAAGLFPVPIMSIYGATKHATVGLTLGLRMEAKTLNINVSVVCPTVVNTPLYDTAIYNGMKRAKIVSMFKGSKVQTPHTAAARIIRATVKNKAIIHTAFSTRFGWAVYRISPSLYMFIAAKFIKTYRKRGRINP